MSNNNNINNHHRQPEITKVHDTHYPKFAAPPSSSNCQFGGNQNRKQRGIKKSSVQQASPSESTHTLTATATVHVAESVKSNPQQQKGQKRTQNRRPSTSSVFSFSHSHSLVVPESKKCVQERLLAFLSSLYFPRAPLLYNRLCSLTLRVRRTVAVVAVQQVPRSQCHTRLHRGHTHTLTHSCTDTLAAATAATTQTPT